MNKKILALAICFGMLFGNVSGVYSAEVITDEVVSDDQMNDIPDYQSNDLLRPSATLYLKVCGY